VDAVAGDVLDEKLSRVFSGRVVRKDLLHEIRGGENVPSYVLEYLLGRYCASNDPQEIEVGKSAVKDTLAKNYFRHDEANKAQSMVEQHGSHEFIDRVQVRFLPSENKYWASMDNFGFDRIHVPDTFFRRYDRLLEGGIWAIVKVDFRPDGEGKKSSPFHIADLKPIQLARFDFDEFSAGRKEFTTDEWIDVIIRSMGLEPQRFERRLKLLLLARLIGFVEKNYNFIELGPRATGKSYAFSEMSPYCILISGGKASSANLFYNNARRQVGLVGYWDVVAFDEVGGMKVNDPDTIQIMKDYMANGRFSRGVKQVNADASLVFLGNLNQPVEALVAGGTTDLFQSLPKEFDLAVLDRFHFYMPGWEVPKISRDTQTKRFGFITDYLAEAFRTLRKENRFDTLEKHFRLGSHVEGRDAIAVKKSVSGYLKLLHPDGEFTTDELREYLELGLESRRRVKEQLKKRGSFEFFKTTFSYFEKDGDREVIVGVPEQGGGLTISQDALPPGMVYTLASDSEARVGLYRLEVTASAGTGKVLTPSGMDREVKESLARAKTYLDSVKERIGMAEAMASRNFSVEAVDMNGSRVACPCGVALYVALISAARSKRIRGGTVILGDLTIQGNIKPAVSILEPLQVAAENGAINVLLPIANRTQFSALPEDVVAKLDVSFYSDLDRALIKALES